MTLALCLKSCSNVFRAVYISNKVTFQYHLFFYINICNFTMFVTSQWRQWMHNNELVYLKVCSFCILIDGTNPSNLSLCESMRHSIDVCALLYAGKLQKLDTNHRHILSLSGPFDKKYKYLESSWLHYDKRLGAI